LPSVPFYPRQVVMDACFAVVLIGILAIIAKTIPMDLGPAANPADTHFLPRPEWYYRPAFQWLKYLSGRWSLIGGILLPALLALIFAAAPFLDRRLERRPWRRPISVGAFLFFLIAYTSLGVASYRDDYRDPGVAAQMRQQDADAKAFMQKPFVPEAAAGSVSAALVSADPKVLKGQALFQAQSCSSCHGDGGMGTAAAGPLTGVGQKYTDPQLVTLLHAPDSKMTNGGMQPVDLKQDDLEALAAYLRQLR
jgi:ubiquinol-cytochrome c reductase cytochrome b subunit